jgi:hypothetical protein
MLETLEVKENNTKWSRIQQLLQDKKLVPTRRFLGSFTHIYHLARGRTSRCHCL